MRVARGCKLRNSLDLEMKWKMEKLDLFVRVFFSQFISHIGFYWLFHLQSIICAFDLRVRCPNPRYLRTPHPDTLREETNDYYCRKYLFSAPVKQRRVEAERKYIGSNVYASCLRKTRVTRVLLNY